MDIRQHISFVGFIFVFFIACEWSPTVAGQECQDLRGAGRCYSWYLQGHCHYGRHVELMARVCAHTCGTCHLLASLAALKRTSPNPRATGGGDSASKQVQQPTTPSRAACSDANQYCASYTSYGYCAPASAYHDYMKVNCQMSCGFCGACKDKQSVSFCKGFIQHCQPGQTHYNYMQANCRATCNFCSGVVVTTVRPNPTKPVVVTKQPVSSKPAGQPQFPCSFDSSTCEWENEHMDDTVDWATGTQQGGPQPAHGSGYMYVDSAYGSGKAKLNLPWNLVLPIGVTNNGDMCLRFKYIMSTNGLLKITSLPNATANNKRPIPKVIFSKKGDTNGWTKANVLTGVTDSSMLIIEGVQGQTGGHVAVDDLAFYPGRC